MNEAQGPHAATIRAALQLAGHPVRGARFKQLIREVDRTFDEKALGYPNLRRFLEAYREIVDVRHDGIDIVVAPCNSPAPPSGNDGTRQIPLVRRDLWRAFAFIDPAVVRFYDRETDEAVMLPRDPTSGETDAVVKLRQAVLNTERFVPIESVTPDEQLALVTRFVDEVADTHPRKRQLESALRAALWFRAFQSALRDDRELDLRWKARWAGQIVDTIKTWAAKHTLNIQNVVTREVRIVPAATRRVSPSPPMSATALTSRSTTRASAPLAAGPATRETSEASEIRRRILRALERLPLPQLLALPIPAASLIEDDD